MPQPASGRPCLARRARDRVPAVALQMAAPCRRCETAFFLSALSGGASFYLAFVFRQICVYRLVNFERFSWISDREREGAATLLSAGRSRQLPSSASPQAVPSPPLPRCGTGDGLGCHTRTSVVAFCACGEAWSLPQLHVPNLFSFTCSVSVLRSTHLYLMCVVAGRRLVTVVCNLGTRKAVCH